MAETVQNIIDSARYDLIDYVDGIGNGVVYDDTELLNYVNRMIGLLDSSLSSMGSDLVLGTEDGLVTTANLDYVTIGTSLNSGLYSRIRNIYIESKTYMTQVGLNYMNYDSQYRKSILEEGDSVAVGDYCKTILRTTTDFETLATGGTPNIAGEYWTCTTAGTMGASDRVWKFSSGRPTLWALEGTKIRFPSVPGAIYPLTIYYDKKTAALALTDNMPYSDIFNETIREMMVLQARFNREGSGDSIIRSAFRKRAAEEEVQRSFVPRRPYKHWTH